MSEELLKYEDDSIWNYHYRDYQGHEIIFRQNVITGLIQMKVTDEMAVANGYVSLKDLNETINRDRGTITILPEWMNVSDAADLHSHLN